MTARTVDSQMTPHQREWEDLRPELAGSVFAGPVPAVKQTERSMLELLKAHYTVAAPGRPPQFLHAEHVRDDANRAKRTADLFVCDTHAGGRAARAAGTEYPMHGFEVKVSRADWVAEMADPSKAEAFRPYVHRWWLAVGDEDIVRAGELPDGWGLVAVRDGALVVIQHAPLNTDVLPLPGGMRTGLMRSLLRTAQVQPAPWRPRPRKSTRRAARPRRH